MVSAIQANESQSLTSIYPVPQIWWPDMAFCDCKACSHKPPAPHSADLRELEIYMLSFVGEEHSLESINQLVGLKGIIICRRNTHTHTHFLHKMNHLCFECIPKNQLAMPSLTSLAGPGHKGRQWSLTCSGSASYCFSAVPHKCQGWLSQPSFL